MIAIQTELRRLWQSLVARGAIMLILGVGAVAWPEPFLVAALVLVGASAVLSGLYEIAIALPLRRRNAWWRLILAHGVACVLFGAMTAGVPALARPLWLAVISGWLLVYAGIAWAAAIFMGAAMPRARWTLVGWGCLQVVLAIVAVAYPGGTIFALLFFGAAYAAAFGVWQIIVGLWLRRRLRRHSADPLGDGFAAALS